MSVAWAYQRLCILTRKKKCPLSLSLSHTHTHTHTHITHTYAHSHSRSQHTNTCSHTHAVILTHPEIRCSSMDKRSLRFFAFIASLGSTGGSRNGTTRSWEEDKYFHLRNGPAYFGEILSWVQVGTFEGSRRAANDEVEFIEKTVASLFLFSDESEFSCPEKNVWIKFKRSLIERPFKLDLLRLKRTWFEIKWTLNKRGTIRWLPLYESCLTLALTSSHYTCTCWLRLELVNQWLLMIYWNK